MFNANAAVFVTTPTMMLAKEVNAAVFVTTPTMTLAKEVNAAVFVTTPTMTLAKEVNAAVFVTTPTMTLAKRSMLLCLSPPLQWHWPKGQCCCVCHHLYNDTGQKRSMLLCSTYTMAHAGSRHNTISKQSNNKMSCKLTGALASSSHRLSISGHFIT